MESLIQKAIKRNPDDEIEGSFDGVGTTLYYACPQSLKPGTWLEDSVTILILFSTRRRSEQQNCKYPKTYTFNSFFYGFYRDDGFQKCKRFTIRDKKADIFSYDIILFPVHLSSHWCMSAANFIEKRFEYYDSLGGSDRGHLDLMRDYLENEHLDKKGTPIDFSLWKKHVNVNNPHQHNGYDCGVFSLMYAKCISEQKAFDFSQKDMDYFRKRIAYEILSFKLLD
ncbi:Peptidase C48, SUMO/Sentrin/Ubl1 domain-containing protein [Rozella allomycis CSF55]|uniref:Peptidase C48, SUMO/Sentrin/Ubl1 domain-containing protein n=1 Tax=Rozella allomycis (strain CSF55) TaxID=988480 RepID=A0A075APP1_ROZAC|nr:Peptidase C48, SUMO/Sentrin/Ubl1 domain-containing protein [Rozella allomycis CSF55]|eukprot:EPZ32086.1 Peptidase C48, SUMO/Sentrin/Ubl1 domain-containing protein [Rozella allomycis CSF55]